MSGWSLIALPETPVLSFISFACFEVGHLSGRPHSVCAEYVFIRRGADIKGQQNVS